LCGNCNGNKKDDLEMASGEIASDYGEFARSYQVGQCDSPIPPPITCTDADRKKW